LSDFYFLKEVFFEPAQHLVKANFEASKMKD